MRGKFILPVLAACLCAVQVYAAELACGDSTLRFAPAADGFGCAALTCGSSTFFGADGAKVPPLWTLVFRAGPAGKEIAVDAAKKPGRCEKNAAGCSFFWKAVDIEKGDGALDVRCDVLWKTGSGRYEFSIKVENRSEKYGLYSTEYPRLGGVVNGKSGGTVIHPGGNWGGVRRSNPWRMRMIYPGYPAPLQMSVFETKAGAGLLVAALDPKACVKTVSLDDKFNFSFVTPAVGAGVPGSVGVQPFPVALYPYSGTWWKAAKHYRAWAESDAGWMKAGKITTRKDHVAKFRKSGLWLLLNSKSNTVANVERLANKALELVKGRVPVSVHWYCWHHHPFDRLYPEFFPTQPGFAEAVSRLEKKGVTVMPYINGRLWDCSQSGYAAVKHAACRKEDGSPCNEVWNKREFSAMCQSTELWKKTMTDVSDRLFAECGVGSLYIDQIASMKPAVCYASDHGHPVGGGSHWVDDYRDIVKRIRRSNPGKSVTSENFAEPYVDVFEGFLTWSPNATNDIPLLPAVYSGYCESFGCRTSPGYTMEAFRAAHGRSFLWGCQQGWESAWILEKKYRERLEYLIRLAELRASATEFFSDGELVADVKNTLDDTELNFKWQRWGKMIPATMPAVQATLWKDPSGNRMVAVCNYSDVSRRFGCEYLDSPIELAPGEVRLLKVGKARSGVPAKTSARFSFDGKTGAIASFTAPDGRPAATGIENLYRFMSKPGDATARERDDKVVSRRSEGESVVFRCVNPGMPDVEIEKRYTPENGGLRRTLTFRYTGNTNAFIQPFTECIFPRSFLKAAWHLGAGYIGPYKPFPRVEKPRQVREYRQSSKGMVLVNPDGITGCFSHYRKKINDVTVLPWWHSTIGHYREYDDRLWYLPDGYRMGLGTFDLKRGTPISVTDVFNTFDGNAFTFFDKVFGADSDVMDEIRSIPPQPAWVGDIFTGVTPVVLDCLRDLAEMTEEGVILSGPSMPIGGWCDYRPENGFATLNGGRITGEELREYVAKQAAVSERIMTSVYNIVISASINTLVLKEYPEWFRINDREGNPDSLFPGLLTNYQTMFRDPECRRWIIDMLFRFADYLNLPVIYLDEAQMTNTIDWDRETVTRDDHTVLFWRELAARASKEGKVLFFNGSGIPYAALNYMESPHELAPSRWRDWVGVAWGIGMMNRFRPMNRTSPLFWTSSSDYVNRILALGWVPRPSYPNHAVTPTLRAVYQSGALVPVDARYTPDWKNDRDTEVESHSVKRTDCSDKLLSFINRAKKTNDVPVTVELDSLGFGGAQVNVWKIRFRKIVHHHHLFSLSNREGRENWRRFRWNDGITAAMPRLVYSGSSTGMLHTVLRSLGTDVMEQLLVTPGPAAFYALNDLPLDYFYTAHRKGRIDGRKVSLKAPADILLAGIGRTYSNVTANGAPAKTSVVDVGGVSCTLVSLPAGEWKLAWKESARPAVSGDDKPLKFNVVKDVRVDVEGDGLYALERDGVTVYTGPSPILLPPRRANGNYRLRKVGGTAAADLKLTAGRISAVKPWKVGFAPAVTNVSAVTVRHGDVTVTGTAEFTGRFETTIFWPEMRDAVAKADARKLTIEAGASRREGSNPRLSAWSGLELKGARKIKMRFDHTFAEAFSIPRGHSGKHSKPETVFTGLAVDFSAGGKYVKRVTMSTGLYSPKYAGAAPFWGTGKSPDAVLELGNFIDMQSGREFSLDLAALAPPDWDGTVYLSVGAERILPGRRMKVSILGFNDDVRDGFVVPVSPQVSGERKMPPPANSRPLRKPPASMTKIDAAEWRSWAPLGEFQLNGTDPKAVLNARTCAWLAHDYDYVYIGVEADETRPPLLDSPQAYRNEHIEFMIVRPEGGIYQVVADAKGRKVLYLDAVEQKDVKNIVTRGEVVPGMGYRVFVAIPVDELKFDMQRTPVKVKGEICRVRLQPSKEYSAWAPLPRAFNDVSKYGTYIFDFNWSNR